MKGLKPTKALIVIVFLILLAGCGQTGQIKESTNDRNFEITKEEVANERHHEATEKESVDDRHPGITENVTPIFHEAIEIDGVVLKPIGIIFGRDISSVKVRNNDWETSDRRSLFGVLGDSAIRILDATDEELARMEEDKQRDAEVIIVFEAQLSDGQRPKIPDVDTYNITLQDDKGSMYYTDYGSFSIGHSPMTPEEVYIETLKFKAYSDAEYFVMNIGEYNFNFDAPEFIKKRN